MSNSAGNKEQGKLLEQTEQQRNPGSAKPEDFTINRGPLDLPAHGQRGDDRKEEAKLIAEGLNGPGKSKHAPTPTRNTAPSKY